MKLPIANRFAPTIMKPASRPLVAIVLASALLAGCSGDNSDLEQWMTQTRAESRISIAKIPEPKRFVPFRYEASLDIDPFSNAKLQVALAKFTERNKGGLKPDLERRREPLESYPLDTIRMVGHLQRPSSGSVALVEVDKVVFQARAGQYIGQNFGRITRVTETEIGLKELVQDAAGDWVEREATLQLQESKK
jgi:type IV pilus assembly protein PilP